MLKSNLSLDLIYNLDKTTNEYLFKPIISNFLYCQTGTIKEFEILQAETYISSYDFKNNQITPMEYVYLNFINRISRAKGSLDIPINIFITFDKRQCPNYCDDSGRYFSSIKIGGVSKVYYVLFSTDEIFDFIYSKESDYVEEMKIHVPYCDSRLEDSSDKDIVESMRVVSGSRYIKGYLDNHNIERGLSFVSISNDSGFPIYHRDFPDILEFKVGSIFELNIDTSNKIEKVVEYHLSEDDQIKGLVQSFNGVLRKRGFSAYITTDSDDIKTIFVPSNIARDFEAHVDIEVSCFARNKKPIQDNQYEWIALQVVESNNFSS